MLVEKYFIMIFQISDNLFWGYKEDINIELFDNSLDILEVILCQLEMKLSELGLEELCKELRRKKFHIPEYNNIISNEDIIYICSHCHGECGNKSD